MVETIDFNGTEILLSRVVEVGSIMDYTHLSEYKNQNGNSWFTKVYFTVTLVRPDKTLECVRYVPFLGDKKKNNPDQAGVDAAKAELEGIRTAFIVEWQASKG